MEGVRPATDDDLGRLAELARAAIAELTPMKGGVVWAAREARPEPLEDSLKASLADDDTHVILGTIDDVPIGYAAVHVEVLNDGSRLGVVDEPMFETGIGDLQVMASHCGLYPRGRQVRAERSRGFCHGRLGVVDVVQPQEEHRLGSAQMRLDEGRRR